MSFSLEQYPARVLKRNSWKDKYIRLLIINNKPIMQSLNINSRGVKEKDISEVAGVFISFSSPNNEVLLKLITKKNTTAIKIPDENDFESFINQVDIILRNSRKSSVCSITQRNRQNFNQRTIAGISSGIGSMNINVSTDLEDRYEDDFRQTPEEDTYVAMTNENIFQKIFNQDYPVTNFNSEINPLESGYIELEESSLRIRHGNIGVNALICWKLRKEIFHEGGIKLKITEINNLSTKEIKKELWISYNNNLAITEKLHIGDRILSINGQSFKDKFDFQQRSRRQEINNIIIQRLPKAKVFSIDPRKFDYKNITFQKKNYYYEMKLNGIKKWWITEVNNENTINMSSNSINFEKDVMTLVVQPIAFVKSLIDSSN